MPTTRRDFLKSTLIAGAGVTLPASSLFAQAPGHRLAASSSAATDAFTLGIGSYPGAPAENFSPHMVLNTTTYRNLALLRPAAHSSAYDFNLTAQLVTDGIKSNTMPRWISTTTSADGTLPIHEREHLLDHWPAFTVEVTGPTPFVQIELGGGEAPLTIDKLKVFVAMPDQYPDHQYTFTASTSEDGRVWKPVGTVRSPKPIDPGTDWPPDLIRDTKLFYPEISLSAPSHSRFFKVEMVLDNPASQSEHFTWKVGQVEFYSAGKRVEVGGPYDFTSAWMSAGLGEEWVAVDLGARCTFDRVALHWISRAAEGSIQVSDDAQTWRDVQLLPASTTSIADDIHLPVAAHARYVRVLMIRPSSAIGYILSEFEVYGRGGPVPHAKPLQPPTPEGRLTLSGGNWKLQRESQVQNPGVELSKSGYRDPDWIVATVPGTVLTSYLNVGAIPDPNYGQNQLLISDSFFYSDFWYRTEFTAPVSSSGQRQFLNFDGINWKADVFLNGQHIGRIEGGFIRGRFDVTSKLRAGQSNAIAVRIEKNATPGSAKQKTYDSPGPNGGAPGADSPTYHASIGWDWIPTIRGRNTGIWGDVFIETTGAVTLANPLVLSKLPLPDISSADVILEVELTNHTAAPVKGTLQGTFGSMPFNVPVTLEPSARTTIKVPTLHIDNPQLWWPIGYGDPHLYDVELAFETAGTISDRKKFKAGIREIVGTEDGGALRLFINGRRFIPRGGNWGFSESMLRYRAREYDAAVRYHREMNFTMIRNWVGQIGDAAFYEACDRHGVVVWQDFWLANPWDGPVPNDNALFLSNVRDTVLSIRHHASIGLYVGRNEGYPPAPIQAGILATLKELHPGIHYIGSSADDVVSGHGPYRALPTESYFKHADKLFHSEIGMPNIPTIESVTAMMPQADLWPQALTWGLHDFCLNGAQGGRTFNETIAVDYGGAHSAEEWITLAQFVNYEGYRAMFEATSKYRMGLLLWMSHPCWPSFVWQTYDFYLEPTAAYFGCKKASEPLHIQWNRATGMVEVVNLSAGDRTGLSAKVEIFNLDGAIHATQTSVLESKEDSVTEILKLDFPAGLTPVHFVRLTLAQGGQLRSENLYLRGTEEGNLRALRELPKIKVQATTTTERREDKWFLSTTLNNTSPTPAVFVRLKAIRERSGDRILPVIYDDNYITLMPGEQRTIHTEVSHADTRSEHPIIVVSGYNIANDVRSPRRVTGRPTSPHTTPNATQLPASLLG